ncbi:helix-turn-helix domain-containing protein, partial [Micromonospora sp. NPDC000207]|uniref:helix-turn-helix domain-containing protein n=1 Tax=Micromonospora sp. NPDC000207 TaxID=3154246 RepID=UPI0033307F81
RVAQWRVRRRMSQQVFADRLGKSKSWVDKVERGVRALDRFSVIQEIGEVLRVDPLVLVGRDAPQVAVSEAGVDGVDRIRAALACYEVLRVDAPVWCPSAAEVHRHVGHAWLTFQHGHYAQLVRMLPGLLQAAQRLHAVDPRQGMGPLVQAYRITASLLVKLGDADLAWLVADRAMTVAADAPVVAATAAVSVGQALRALGRDRLAWAATVSAAQRMAAPSLRRTPEVLPVFGVLLVEAAHAAAACGDRRGVVDLLDQATVVAEQVGGDVDQYQTGFGPVAVALADVVTTAGLGDVREAVRRHEQVVDREQWGRLPAEHRAAYLIDVVRAYLHLGDLAGAGRLLVEADRLAAAEVRCRPIGRTVLAEVYRDGPPSAGVARLVTAVGVARSGGPSTT